MIQLNTFKLKDIDKDGGERTRVMACLQVGKYVEFITSEGDFEDAVGRATTELMRKVNEARDKVPESGGTETKGNT